MPMLVQAVMLTKPASLLAAQRHRWRLHGAREALA
jgi:hypothetical protein